MDYQWSKLLEIGNVDMDTDHKLIIAKMANLSQLNVRAVSKAGLLRAYDDLVKFTEKHFVREEAHMASMGYPELEIHVKIHQALLLSLEKYREEFVTSVYGRFPSAVFDFFNNWITTHIIIVDQKYGEFEKRKRPVRVETGRVT